jgi:hypothetical protein
MSILWLFLELFFEILDDFCELLGHINISVVEFGPIIGTD